MSQVRTKIRVRRRQKPDRKELERIGVSLEKDLLSGFDALIADQGYQSRSEAIRDLLRRRLSAEQLSNPKARVIAAVHLVYNHHSTRLMEKLTDLQHRHLLETICTTHVHLDAHDCLEIIVLKGRAGQIKKMAEKMLSTKGVKLGRVNFISSGGS